MKRYNNSITIYPSDHIANTKNNVYQTQGLGTLPDATVAFVEGEFQGLLTLHMTYPLNGHNADLIEDERILQTKISDGKTQLLRIYEVTKSVSGHSYVVKAEPVINGLRKHFITQVKLDQQVSIDTAWNAAANATAPAVDKGVFKIQVNSDATNSMASVNFEAGNLLQFFAGKEGSLLDYRNPLEFEKDNSTMIIGRNLGRAHAMTAQYKRNLTGLDYTINTQGVVTAYYPFAKVKVEGSDEEKLIELSPKVIVLDSAKNYNGTTKTLDFSEDDTVTDTATLRAAYDKYFAANEAERTPLVQCKIDMVSLRNQQGYSEFISWDTIFLGDYVDVIHSEWDMTLSARIVKYNYNILTDRYDSLELGDVKRTFIDDLKDDINGSASNIMDKINDIIADLPTTGETADMLNDMANQITGNAGGNIVLDPPTRPERLLIMDTDNLETAKNVIMMNQQGILMGQNGVDGEFSSAWTIEGIFNAKWIQTGILAGNNLRLNLDTGEVSFTKGQIQSLDNTFLIDISDRRIFLKGKSDFGEGSDDLNLLVWNGEVRTNFETYKSGGGTNPARFMTSHNKNGIDYWLNMKSGGTVPIDASVWDGNYTTAATFSLSHLTLPNGLRSGSMYFGSRVLDANGNAGGHGYRPWMVFFGTGPDNTTISLSSGSKGYQVADFGKVMLNGNHEFYSYMFKSSATRSHSVTNNPRAVYVDANGELGYQASARKYKTNIQPAYNAIANAERILEIEPKQWASVLELKQTGQSSIGYGFIAEDFEDLGLDEIIIRDQNGEIDTIAYEKISIYLLEVIKKMSARIDDLEMRTF